jgi:hypothetical protein
MSAGEVAGSILTLLRFLTFLAVATTFAAARPNWDCAVPISVSPAFVRLFCEMEEHSSHILVVPQWWSGWSCFSQMSGELLGAVTVYRFFSFRKNRHRDFICALSCRPLSSFQTMTNLTDGDQKLSRHARSEMLSWRAGEIEH